MNYTIKSGATVSNALGLYLSVIRPFVFVNLDEDAGKSECFFFKLRNSSLLKD
jgi:hypothetical protein